MKFVPLVVALAIAALGAAAILAADAVVLTLAVICIIGTITALCIAVAQSLRWISQRAGRA